MTKEMSFVHLGKTPYNPDEVFVDVPPFKIMDSTALCKPYTGLWASPQLNPVDSSDYISEWEEFTIVEQFMTCDRGYTFSLTKDANILELLTPRDFDNFKYKYKALGEDKFYYIDFSRVMKDYDGMFVNREVLNYGSMRIHFNESQCLVIRMTLYYWGVESLVVWNNKAIDEDSIKYFSNRMFFLEENN